MISVAEAKLIIQEHCSPLLVVSMALNTALGSQLAEDVFASTDIPPFNQSAVDGYAFAFDEWQNQKKLIIKGEIPAGDNSKSFLITDNTVRIFTGAPVPDGADTVVMQERTKVLNDQLFIEDLNLSKGSAVRLKGSEIQAGERALERGTYLSPAAIGFLASIGVIKVSVLKKPTLSIIVTGNELQEPGKPLEHGQVYECNSFGLVAALKQLNLNDVNVYWAKDSPEDIKHALTNSLVTSDIVLLTGGVSVGDYDFVLEAASSCGISKLFHQVKQKPGKPLYFGKKENKYVFGLPGNPASVLTCFYEYVIPALRLLNPSIKDLHSIHTPVTKPINKMQGLTHFLKGYYNGNSVTPLDAQESYRLSSFAKANCLICIDENLTSCFEGVIVEIHLLPT